MPNIPKPWSYVRPPAGSRDVSVNFQYNFPCAVAAAEADAEAETDAEAEAEAKAKHPWACVPQLAAYQRCLRCVRVFPDAEMPKCRSCKWWPTNQTDRAKPTGWPKTLEFVHHQWQEEEGEGGAAGGAAAGA